MTMQLRPYQVEAAQAVEREWQSGHSRTLLVLPTGTGKTVVFAQIAASAVRQGKRVLILAHRGELLEQAADKIFKTTGLKCAVEKAEQSCKDSFYRIVVGSIQSLQRSARLESFPQDYFDTIIIDEAHHAISDGYQAVLNHFSGAEVLGVTATPDRGDLRNLGSYFDSLAYEYTLPKAIREGYLTKIMVQTIPLQIDLNNVAVQNGDYKPGDVGNAIEPYFNAIAAEMADICADRRTVVFLPLIETSKKFKEVLEAHGMTAAEVNGNSEDRAEVIADFAAGKYQVLCNALLLVEGWDCPEVDCVVVLRPTKVRSLYTQMIGRGTRLAHGKKELLVLDFLWLSERHELCRPAYLIADSPEKARKMTELTENEQCAIELEELEKEAETAILQEREEALAKALEEMRTRKRKLVDPLQFEMSIAAEDLANFTPVFGWQMGPPSDKQKAFLEKRGIFPEDIENAGKAKLLIDRLIKRQKEGLSTPKQIRFLEGRGFRHVGTWPFEAARKMIDRIAANGWRIPRDIDVEAYRPADTAS